MLIGGFGMAGMPVELIDALIRQGATDLTVVSNNAGNGDTGLAALLAKGRVRKMICSFPRQSDSWVFDGLYRDGQGRARGGAAGQPGRADARGRRRDRRVLLPDRRRHAARRGQGDPRDRRPDYVLEYPIKGDVALIGAHVADRMGNLVYRKTARNFGPVMATAADTVIAQVVAGRRRSASSTPRSSSPRASTSTGWWRHEPRRPLSKDEMAALVARDIPAGSYVNLGIGQPTLVADYLEPDSGVVLHTENGMLGMGPAAAGDEIDPDLTNAGKIPVTELPGASYFHHADSFAMMRGGHLDVCVLGAFQVSAGGDLANWHTGAPDAIPAVGGAMDLAIGAKQVLVMMTLFAKDGSPKLVPECTYPLTGVRCVEPGLHRRRDLPHHPRRRRGRRDVRDLVRRARRAARRTLVRLAD